MKKIISFIVFILLPVLVGFSLFVISLLNYDSVEDKFPFNLGIDENALRAIFGVTGLIVVLLPLLSTIFSDSIKDYFKKKRKLKESKKDSWDDFADIEPQESWFGDSCCDCGQYSHQTIINPQGMENTKAKKPRKFFPNLLFILAVAVSFFWGILVDFLGKKDNLLRIGIIISFTMFILFINLASGSEELQKELTLYRIGMGSAILGVFILVWFVRRTWTSGLAILILVGIFSTSPLNAQEPSETEYMGEMILESFHYEKSFLDPTTGIKYFSELYGREGFETKLGIATVVFPKGKGNFLWMGLFNETENSVELSICEKFSFKFLQKIYRSLMEKEITHFPLWKGFSMNIPFGDNDYLPGEFLIIDGEVFNEDGEVCVFDVEYRIENLWLNKRDFNRGYPQPEEYNPSEVGDGNYKAIKLENSSLNYTP